MVLAIYADYAGKKYDSTHPLPPTLSNKINLRNTQPLDREEIFYAMDTLLAWNGIKMVTATNGLMRAVPVSNK